VIVRRAVPADADEMARVHTLSSQAAYAHIAPPESGGLERRRRVWREILEADSSSFVAEADGVVVGVLHVTGDELKVIYVHPDWWGRGAGRLLLEAAHAELARTCRAATLTVLADNPRARRFYERNGWVCTDELTEPHFGGVPTRVARYRRSMGV
jgi:GNAT superfamily N-acetyltransferase